MPGLFVQIVAALKRVQPLRDLTRHSRPAVETETAQTGHQETRFSGKFHHTTIYCFKNMASIMLSMISVSCKTDISDHHTITHIMSRLNPIPGVYILHLDSFQRTDALSREGRFLCVKPLKIYFKAF